MIGAVGLATVLPATTRWYLPLDQVTVAVLPAAIFTVFEPHVALYAAASVTTADERPSRSSTRIVTLPTLPRVDAGVVVGDDVPVLPAVQGVAVGAVLAHADAVTPAPALDRHGGRGGGSRGRREGEHGSGQRAAGGERGERRKGAAQARCGPPPGTGRGGCRVGAGHRLCRRR